MLLFINKYFRRQSKDSKLTAENKKREKDNKEEMLMHCATAEASQPCRSRCYPALLFGLAESNTRSVKTSAKTTTTTRVSRSNFVKSTSSSLFPNINFTNHESLPSLSAAFTGFNVVYPQYSETQAADNIRESEYYHLCNHVCFDYTGISLFSYSQMISSMCTASSSSNPPSSSNLQPPFFTISYKSASLKTQVRYGNHETGLESTIRRKIMEFLNIDDEDYSMVCTANRTTAFRLLAESYPFDSNKKLLTVYDYESEAVNAMAESAQKRGAKVSSANFTWPNLRINSARLNKKLSEKKKKANGLFVFPLQSRMTGARYPYLWMTLAKDNGWQVVLDASALGPKELGAFGLSLIKPDFIVCSFFKVFGENPSGFAGLFIKKSSIAVLETSVIARSIGIVSLVPPRSLSQLSDHYSEKEIDQDEVKTTSSFSGPLSAQICNGSTESTSNVNVSSQKQKEVEIFEQPETSNTQEARKGTETSSEIVELSDDNFHHDAKITSASKAVGNSSEIECRALDHAESLGLLHIGNRLRYITNWLVTALLKLRHPHSENGHSLVNIYGPKIKFDRGPALAFNVFDWKGEKIDPALVQKLADRSNISLCCGFLQNIWFPDKYAADRDLVLERRAAEKTVAKKRKENIDVGISVVNASLSFLTNFEDAYRLWTFVAKFLDADFVEKERWRYMALNQKMIEV